ncbi:MAG: diacylglycerol kinase family protein [Bdellovibrionota bacterium]
MRNVAVLLNPNARRMKKVRDLPRYAAERYGKETPLIVTQDLPALQREVKEIARRELDLLVMCGGDGTFRHFYETWFNVLGEGTPPPPVLPLPGGSQNYVCRDTGTYFGIFSFLKYLRQRQLLASGEFRPEWLRVRERNLLRIDDPSAGKPQYGFAYTDGLFFRVGKAYYENGADDIAALKAVWGTAVEGFFSKDRSRGVLAPSQARVRWDRQNGIVTGHMTLLTSTLDRLLLDLEPFPEADATGTGFHVFVLFSENIRQSVLHLALHGRKGSKGPRWPEPGVITTVVPELSVEGSEGYALEGELYYPPNGKTDFKMSLGPKVRLASLVPALGL